MTSLAGIERMKMSANGEMIVFNTVAGKLYTLNTESGNLTRILAKDGRGFLDISADGTTIIFTKMLGGKISVFINPVTNSIAF